mgnify:CR=1 FL=1
MFRGTITVPGDKSITHRALLIAAMADGTSEIINPLRSLDCESTVGCLRALGVEIEEHEGKTVVHGVGLEGLQPPAGVLDCGNSGTTMRLLAGVLAAQPFVSVLSGDDSLSARPMGRIVEPLRQMGALVKGRAGDQFAPLVIRGGRLQGITYALPVASAQVKSALLLAGLAAQGEQRLQGKIGSRDHTERMLEAFGAAVECTDEEIVLRPGNRLRPQIVEIPGDISAAAFFLAAAAAVPGAEVTVDRVGLNPTRTGFLQVLQEMGAELAVEERGCAGGEPWGSVSVRGAQLRGVTISGEIIPRLVDEIPALAVAAALAEGDTVIRDAAELRVKETDRIQALVEALGSVGVKIEALPDGLIITGPARWRAGTVDGRGDHRIAMALLTAAALSDEPISVLGTECVSISFPTFMEVLHTLVQGA